MTTDYLALTALSPLDGRYRSQLTATADIFSEANLIKQRIKVEVAYLLFLSDKKLIPKLSLKDRRELEKLAIHFSLKQANEVKKIEVKTKHDVKAVEYFLRQFLTSQKSALEPFVHLALTSEDTNSIAYSLLLKQAQIELLVPQLKNILQQLSMMAKKYQAIPMLARTHGQPAIPTTVGKEISVFAMRLLREIQELEALPIEAKLTGAVGNFNAHQQIFPHQKWLKLSTQFISQLGLQANLFTTQIMPSENYTKMFSSLLRINIILIDLNQDVWRYISDNYFIQTIEKHQVGSSTMPHKVNPIDFENSEGNLGLANALLSFFIQKLPISRLQRDLSDSTVKRSWGQAVGYSVLAYNSLLKGLAKLSVNQPKLAQDLADHWEVVSEGWQVVLRMNGVGRGYEQLQKLSQGKKLTQSDLQIFGESLDLPKGVKKQLLALTPATYIGLAVEITQQAIQTITSYLQGNV